MLKLYNFLSKQKEEFKPIHPGKVGLYVCGPTVYDHCHLGHGRGYVSMDIMRRYLEYIGLEVRHIMNYTDVGHLVDNAEVGEDKVEQKARKEKIDPINIANSYIISCQEDFASLNIKSAHANPRPTQYIAQIIKYVESLIAKGYAYEANGSVYFSVEKFPEYGKLSGRKTDDLQDSVRIEVNPEKKNPLDFALWIKAESEHILKWDSPWSLGYPGWHIECSVMSCDLLGQDTFDIHGGGNENVFPHNENELTQSEAYLNRPMVNIWALWAMVNVDGTKMSKSLGNFITVKDAIKKYDGSTVRLWIISAHYRSVINYSEESIAQAKANLQRISDFAYNLEATKTHPSSADKLSNIKVAEYEKRFEDSMNDDLNTPQALAVLYDLITKTNSLLAENKITSTDAAKVLALWHRMNSVFGLELKGQAEIPEEILKLANERKVAKQKKEFSRADEIRAHVEKMGYIIEDTKDGFKIKRAI